MRRRRSSETPGGPLGQKSIKGGEGGRFTQGNAKRDAVMEWAIRGSRKGMETVEDPTYFVS